MTDPSLNRRLDQHARRSGFAVGASMALAILLLIGAFVWLFATINPYLSDFLGAQAASSTATPASIQAGAPLAPTARPVQSSAPSVAPTATIAPTEPPAAAPTVAPTQVPPTETPDDFQPDYQVAGNQGINFRSAAGTNGSETLAVVNPGTPLQSTGEEETVEGVVWLQFINEDGQTGWIREIDTEPV
ncbi:MAG: hypothetical protein AVDCRST_MAG33-1762 [uncultured Thermomicrobiales bacterium]|uniref:SH3b domain-containing protein n=1 Tax=uncultured Thermomicrobiales bacterium TaxID=1645740 RepID=A0A6J4UWR6_9BACT|nr:MAG: hypothetical protein AVDCRST_MAG33-1762 [uncultured Thermomicrobiales bacterium]